MQTLLSWYDENRVRPHASETYPQERALEGLQRVLERKSTGRIVISMDAKSAESVNIERRTR
jgi:NADPH2:quinone reductase